MSLWHPALAWASSCLSAVAAVPAPPPAECTPWPRPRALGCETQGRQLQWLLWTLTVRLQCRECRGLRGRGGLRGRHGNGPRRGRRSAISHGDLADATPRLCYVSKKLSGLSPRSARRFPQPPRPIVPVQGLLDAPDAAESGRGRSPARGKETERGRARDRGSGASGREALAAHDRGRERSGPREQSRHPPERAAWVDRRELFRAVDGRESRGEGRVDERRGSRGAEGDRGPERRAAGREADDRGRGRSVDDARRDSERDPARPRSSGPPLQPGPVPARGLEMGRMRVVPVGVPRGMARAGPSPMRGPVPGPVPEWAPSPRNGPVGRGPGVSPVGMGRGPIPRGVPMGPGPMVRPMGPVVPRTLSRERGPMPVARGPLPMGPRPHPGVGVAPVLRPPERVPSRPLVMVPVAAREAMPRGPGGRPPPAAFRPREAAMRAPMPDVMDRDVARREGGGRAPEPLGGGPVPREVHRSAGRAVAEGAREAAIWARRERDDESRKHERSEGRPPGSGVRSEGAWSKGGHDEATAHVRNDEAQLSPQAPRDAGGRADEGSWCAAAATPPSGRAVEERGDGGRAKESERGAELARGQGQERVREMGEERHRRREGEGRGDVGAGQEPRSSQGPETGRGASGKVEREGQEDFSGRGDRSRSRSRSPRGPLSHREAPTPSMAPGRARSPASPERPGIVGSEAVQLPLPPPPGLGAPSRATVQAEMGRDLPLPPPPAAAGHPSHRDAVLGEAPAHIHAATREAGALPLPPPPGPLPHHDRSPGLGTPLPPPPVREERNDAHGHPPSASGHWERETRARDRRSGDLPLPSPPKGSPMGHVSPGPPLPPPPAPVGSSAGHLPLPPGVARRSVDGPQGTVSLSSGPPTIPPPVAQVTIATRSSADSRDGAGRGRLGMASSNGEVSSAAVGAMSAVLSTG